MLDGFTEGAQCTSMKRVTGQAKNFVCTSCTTLDEDGVEPIENLCDGLETAVMKVLRPVLVLRPFF